MSARAAAARADVAAASSSGACKSSDADEKDAGGSEGGRKRKRKVDASSTPTATDAEFGVSRGVDFCDVTAVINMDLPRGLPTYKHRVGRTARAGQGGTAISMVDENEPLDGQLLESLQEEFGAHSKLRARPLRLLGPILHAA